MTEHPAPWWYCLAERALPERCREIPEAQNPERIVLRQVALISRHLYLQQFASSEDASWMHSHQWHFTIALGLWGSYTEWRPGAAPRERIAPYLYWMDESVIHHVQAPSEGHTSLFLGLWRDDGLKYYHGVEGRLRRYRTGVSRLWSDHVIKQVKRI